MIQRIQSIWLLLAALFAFASLKISFYSGMMTVTSTDFTELNGMYDLINNILTISIAVIALITIFIFKNRGLQIRLIVTAMILELALMFRYEFLIRNFDKGNYTIGSVLQLLLMISFILAIRGIRKDNKLISESDRLR